MRMTAYLLHHESASKCKDSELKLESIGIGKPKLLKREIVNIEPTSVEKLADDLRLGVKG